MAGQLEPMGVPDLVLQVGNVLHIHIKNAAAHLTFDVIVGMTPPFKAVRPARDLDPADLACLRQPVQVPVHRGPADRRMFLGDGLIDLIGGHMPRQLVDGLQHQRALNCISIHHSTKLKSYSFFIDIIYQ